MKSLNRHGSGAIVALTLTTIVPSLTMAQSIEADTFAIGEYINPDYPIEDERFGIRIAMDGLFAIASAPGKLDGSSTVVGRVLIYRRDQSGWKYLMTLRNPDERSGDTFGSSVDIYRDTIVIGARMAHDDRDVRTGKAFVYRKPEDGWANVEGPDVTLVPVDGQHEDAFGSCVAIVGDTILVGAPFMDSVYDNSGSVYVYRHDGETWREEQVLISPTPTLNEQFGSSIAVDDGMMAVGAPNVKYHDAPGSVHCFTLTEDDQWTLLQSFGDREGELDGDHFGRDLALEFDRSSESGWLVVGATGVNEHAGSVTIYRYQAAFNAWDAYQTLTASDGDIGDHFGFSVSIVDRWILAGATHEESDGFRQVGATYIFGLSGDERWIQRRKLMSDHPRSGDALGFATAVGKGRGSGRVAALIGVPQRDQDGSEEGDYGSIVAVDLR